MVLYQVYDFEYQGGLRLITWNLIWTMDMDSSVRCQGTILDVPGLFYEVLEDHFECLWSIIYVMMVVKGLMFYSK
jgi:hypothetical protein